MLLKVLYSRSKNALAALKNSDWMVLTHVLRQFGVSETTMGEIDLIAENHAGQIGVCELAT